MKILFLARIFSMRSGFNYRNLPKTPARNDYSPPIDPEELYKSSPWYYISNHVCYSHRKLATEGFYNTPKEVRYPNWVVEDFLDRVGDKYGGSKKFIEDQYKGFMKILSSYFASLGLYYNHITSVVLERILLDFTSYVKYNPLLVDVYLRAIERHQDFFKTKAQEYIEFLRRNPYTVSSIKEALQRWLAKDPEAYGRFDFNIKDISKRNPIFIGAVYGETMKNDLPAPPTPEIS